MGDSALLREAVVFRRPTVGKHNVPDVCLYRKHSWVPDDVYCELWWAELNQRREKARQLEIIAHVAIIIYAAVTRWSLSRCWSAAGDNGYSVR